MKERKNFRPWLPLFFALVLIAGMIIGFVLRSNTTIGQGFLNNSKRSSVQEIIDLINMKYVDSVDTDTLTDIAISDILLKLDPHSIYIPPIELPEVNEDLQGNFQGIGIEFYIFKDTVNIVSVLKDGPSEKAGLQVGDQFIKVGDSIVAGNKITSDRIRKILRGEANTNVTVMILRNGKQIKYTIKRGAIPVPSVDVAYMINKQTGFIRINKFAEPTYREFMKSLETLQAQGMQQLILDLRDNGGGILEETVKIADEFLDNDKLIVFTKGNHVPTNQYKCKKPGLFEKGDLVVLIDENSASASEVLTGALQDWDRATIVGRRSFGKGLVQEQYELSDGGAVRLTVARYYTPSGRSIQKPYSENDHYYDDLSTRYAHGDLLNADSNKIVNDKPFKTSKGKTVYGGGGIMPDIFVPYDTSVSAKNIAGLFAVKGMNNFIHNYYIRHKKVFDTYKTSTDFVNNFSVEDAWKELLESASVDLTQTLSPDQIEAAKTQLKALLARLPWKMQGYYEVMNKNDLAIQKAIEVINK